MRGHGREAREEGRVHGRRQPGVEAVLRVGAGRRHGAERAAAAAARGGSRRAGLRRLRRLRRLLGRRRRLRLGLGRRLGLGLGRRRRGLHRPGGAEAGQRRRRRRGAASPSASGGPPAPAADAAARVRKVRALQAAEGAGAERPAGQEVTGTVEQRVVGGLHGARRGVHRRRRGGQARIGGLGGAALTRGRALARAARASVAAPRGCGRRRLELREWGQVGRALPRGEVLRREVLRMREAELLLLLLLLLRALGELRRLEERAGRRRRAEPAGAVERRRLRVRRVGKVGRAELFPLLAAQLLLLPLTEVLRGGGAAAAAGGGGGGGGVVQTRFEVLGGEEVGHTRVRAAAGVVVGEFLRGRRPRERPRRLLCQPQQQLILHGLLMRQERGGRGSAGGRAARAAAAEGDREGGGALREAGDRQRRRRERAEGRGGGQRGGGRGGPRGVGTVRPATEQGPGAAASERGCPQHPKPEVPHLSGRRRREQTRPVRCPA